MNLNDALEQHLIQLTMTNEKICEGVSAFATINSSFRIIYPDLNNFYREMALSEHQVNNASKYNFSNNFESLSNDISLLLKLEVVSKLYDDFTINNLNEIKQLFDQIVGVEYKTAKYQIPPSITLKIRKIAQEFDASTFIKTATQNVQMAQEIPIQKAIKSLNKFMFKIEHDCDKLENSYYSLKATREQREAFKILPSPQIIEHFPEFQKYVVINRKLLHAINSTCKALQPYIDKLNLKQQQIAQAIKGVNSVLLEIRGEYQKFIDYCNELTNINERCHYLRLVDKTMKDYPFYSRTKHDEQVSSWLNSEADLIKSALGTNFSQEMTAHDQLLNCLEILRRLCVNFKKELKNNNVSLSNREAAKKKTSSTFEIKYGSRENSDPSPSLINARQQSDSLQTDFDQICAQIQKLVDKRTASLFKINEGVHAFISLHKFFISNTALTNPCASTSGLQWESQFESVFKKLIEQKRKEIKELAQQEANKRKMIEEINSLQIEHPEPYCKHMKTLCITTCGHTICEQCLASYIQTIGMKCCECKTPFTQTDIIRINW